MTDQLLMSLYIFALAGFVGHYVIESVPPLLHTPLDGRHQRHQRHLAGGIARGGRLGARHAGDDAGQRSPCMCASINTVGGFLITDRMLKMFKSKEKPGKAGAKKS